VITDPVFPFPDPVFLWVHNIAIIKTSDAVPESDDEGWEIPADPAPLEVVLKGYVTAPDPEATNSSERVDAVVLVPRDTVVSYADGIRTPSQANLAPMLTGVWKISSVRPNPSHIRILVRRPSSPDDVQLGEEQLL